jgi:plastocyanin
MPDRRPRRYLRPAFATTILGAVTVAVLGVALVVTAPVAGAQSSGGGGNTIEGTAALKWQPASLTVKPGSTITFKVTGSPPHPVGLETSPTGSPDFDTSKCQLAQMSAVGSSCTVKVPKAGTYKYVCEIHKAVGMVGTIIVGSGGGGSATPTPEPTPSASATPDTPTAATTPPGKPGIYYAGWGLLAVGGVLALAAIAGYLRFAPDFSRGRK